MIIKRWPIRRHRANQIVRILVLAGTLLLFTHRLPAPIQEVPESPMPATEQSAKPKPKRAIKPKVTSEDSRTAAKQTKRGSPPSPQGQSAPFQKRFAGVWSGPVTNNSIVWSGEHQMTFIINDAENSVRVEPQAGVGAATTAGDTISWQSTWYWNEWSWTLTPAADGRTARVAAEFAAGGSASGLVSRVTSSSSAQAPRTANAVSKIQQTELPVARLVPGKPGFVYNPYNPNSKVLLDVRGKAAGTKLKDPFSGKLFITP
jgi:hypothetical protein